MVCFQSSTCHCVLLWAGQYYWRRDAVSYAMVSVFFYALQRCTGGQLYVHHNASVLCSGQCYALLRYNVLSTVQCYVLLCYAVHNMHWSVLCSGVLCAGQCIPWSLPSRYRPLKASHCAPLDCTAPALTSMPYHHVHCVLRFVDIILLCGLFCV